jgi:hypothetical protein
MGLGAFVHSESLLNTLVTSRAEVSADQVAPATSMSMQTLLDSGVDVEDAEREKRRGGFGGGGGRRFGGGFGHHFGGHGFGGYGSNGLGYSYYSGYYGK